ncbi:hypothetical protein CBR_g30032 [Chara braunii]|uniref:Uncharacterized protein n=1 Tax=Chara braunii TaxID=69332 RepID=A0A388LBT7_CHABU|nr:hypothetical protein CBR_g30032 [Chara braunii]|eukprot:GBG79768.1 hypothetical protein CBR_g30032 [Chara braunii]
MVGRVTWRTDDSSQQEEDDQESEDDKDEEEDEEEEDKVPDEESEEEETIMATEDKAKGPAEGGETSTKLEPGREDQNPLTEEELVDAALKAAEKAVADAVREVERLKREKAEATRRGEAAARRSELLDTIAKVPADAHVADVRRKLAELLVLESAHNWDVFTS